MPLKKEFVPASYFIENCVSIEILPYQCIRKGHCAAAKEIL